MEHDFRTLFDEWSDQYDETVSGQDEQYREVFAHYETILSEVAQRAITPVLEFGVGTGNLTERLLSNGLHVYGVEPSEKMRQITSRKLPSLPLSNGHFLQFDAPEHVRSIVSTYAFHHLTDEEKKRAAARFRDILPAGGKVIFADTMFANDDAREATKEWAADHQYDRLLEDLNREFYTTMPIMTDVFEQNGFRVQYTRMNDFVWLIEAEKE